MVQHVADWVVPFLHSQHSPPPPSHKLFHIPPSPPHLLLSLTCTTVRGNYHHHQIVRPPVLEQGHTQSNVYPSCSIYVHFSNVYFFCSIYDSTYTFSPVRLINNIVIIVFINLFLLCGFHELK